MHDPIATTKLISVYPDGTRIPVTIAIGRPQLSGTEAICPVLLDGVSVIGEKVRPVRGEDTFQALALAMRFVRNMLAVEEERGIRFMLDGDDEPFDWRTCWFSEDA